MVTTFMKNKPLIIIVIITILGAGFLFLPMLSILLYSTFSIETMLSDYVLKAIVISLESTLISLAATLILGIPISWLMARYSFKGKGILHIVFRLPTVLPPSVAGVLLLLCFGRAGFIGKYLDLYGINISFSFIAVVMAQTFIILPQFITATTHIFKGVDKTLEDAAMDLGLKPYQVFYKLTLPMCKKPIVTQSILCWARALSEFGATIIFAGNLTGKTQTLPLAIYMALEKDLNLSVSISMVLVIISLAVILGVKKYEMY
ncbi:ABC transporter permease [Clostridium sp.]|uniref:ABC transporter permease n=1 Tax=Clostridium sp. TaxID=1506 RepID=UPI003464E02C